MNIKETTEAMVFTPRFNENRKNTITAVISTYEGKDKNGKSSYCSWYTHFVGNAYQKATSLQDKDKIVILSANIENQYNKEQEKTYITLTIFDFEMKDIYIKNKKLHPMNDEGNVMDYSFKDNITYFEDNSITPEEFDEGDTYIDEEESDI